jgi:hypothetical protein
MNKYPTLIFLILTLFFFCPQLSAQDLYDTDSVQEMYITFSESNWDYLLDSLVNIGDDRLMAQSVIINGVSFDSAGVRFKGNSSYQPNNSKNPLNVKLSYLKDQDYDGYQTFKLSSGFKDPTFAREVFSYEIARKYMAAPKANYMNVYINGTLYGLFTNVEPVNKDFLENYYSSNDNILFKCDGLFGMGGPPPTGCMGGGGSALGFMGTDSFCYYDHYELKRDYGWASLANAIDVLNNNSANVAQAFYVDRALWMLAFNNMLVNFDSYTGSKHNYYVYQDQNDRYHTILWDLNEAFGVFGQSGSGPPMTIADMKVLDPLHNMTSIQHPLLNKLLAVPEYKKTYIAHLRTIFNENFGNGLYSTRLAQIEAVADASVQADANKIYTYQNFLDNYSVDVSNVPGLNDFISSRVTYLNTDPEMTKSPPAIATPVESLTTVQTDDTLYITSAISNASSVKLRYRFGQYDVFLEKDMLDDGTQNDGAASDGTYGAYVVVPATGAQYYIYAENNDAAMLSPERAEYEFYTVSTTTGLVPVSLVINEFMASNTTVVPDQNGEFDDWVELYNNTASDISLSGLYLSDDFSNATKWAFPDTSIAANDYLIVWVDDDATQQGLHTGFKLSSSGEELAIFDNSGNILDSVSFSVQATDITTGRFPNGTGPFISMTPTFSAVNVDNNAVHELSSLSKNWSVFPNPVKNQQLSVRVNMSKSCQIKCSVSNAIGQKVWEQKFEVNSGVNTLNIPSELWAEGVYTISIQDVYGFQAKQVLKF